jgi:hypothetical protein
MSIEHGVVSGIVVCMREKDRINVYLDRETKERVREIADAEKRSMNGQVQFFIELAMKKFPRRIRNKEELQPAA